MNTFTVYRLADGAIVGHVTCLDRDLDLNVRDGCSCIPGFFAADGYTVDHASGQALVRQVPLHELMDRKWEEIKTAREEEKVSPFLTTPFGVFDAGTEARANLQGTLQGLAAAAQLGIAPATIEWTLADDSAVVLTPAQLAQVAVLLLARGDGAHRKARQLRSAIYSATTAAQVWAVTWASAGS